jgi:hypothetical protein
MPYIDPIKRPKLDILIGLLDENLKFDGDLNYVLYALCKRHVKPSYNNYKNYLGELHECEEEIRRRLLRVYENKKMRENGDV